MGSRRSIPTKSNKPTFRLVLSVLLGVALLFILVLVHRLYGGDLQSAVPQSGDSAAAVALSSEEAGGGSLRGSVRPRSRYAYVTLIHGIDSSRKYTGFLYNTIIMATSLKRHGSTADIVAMIGFAANASRSEFKSDLQLLEQAGIIIHYLPRLLDPHTAVSFAEMALLKITPFSFTHYDKIQFFDGDIMPKQNMDCYFELQRNFFTTGTASPLNSGWFLGIPNQQQYEEMKKYALARFSKTWDKQMGWGTPIPDGMVYRTGKPVIQWEFNGANLDQGLFTHYFVLGRGNVGLIDTKEVKLYDQHNTQNPWARPTETITSIQEAMACCNGKTPTSKFAHFTGQNKPWLFDASQSSNSNLKLWATLLDELNLPYNSSNIFDQGFKPPLGYWAKT